MSAPRYLAITPPGEKHIPDPGVVDCWQQSGLSPGEGALLLRRPGYAVDTLLSRSSGLEPLRTNALRRGLRVFASIERAELARGFELVERGEIDGVHVRGRPYAGPSNEAALDARACQVTLGRSAHLADLRAESVPIDPPTPARELPSASYWTFAPVFTPRFDPTGATKTPAGIVALKLACRQLRAPVLALGGIDASRAASCLYAGAHGFAGIGCFFGSHKQVAHDAGAFARAFSCVLATT